MPNQQPDKRPAASDRQPTSPDAEIQSANAEQESVQAPDSSQEYDRRGVLLPARARVGGIITPQ